MKTIILILIFTLLSGYVFADVLYYREGKGKYIEAMNKDGSISTIPKSLKNNDYLNYLKAKNVGVKPLTEKTPYPKSKEEVRADWVKANPIIAEKVQPDTAIK